MKIRTLSDTSEAFTNDDSIDEEMEDVNDMIASLTHMLQARYIDVYFSSISTISKIL